MRANLSSKLLVLAAMAVGLGLAYCGGTVETDPTTGTAEDPANVGTITPTPIDHPFTTPAPAAVPSYRIPGPAVVPEAPPAPTEHPCPGCPPPPGVTPVDLRGSPIDRPS
jgi:hypothetical protein